MRLRHDGFDAPLHLTRDTGDLMQHWQSPDLILSQTCGFPYRAHLSENVQLVGTPALDLPCSEGLYYSVLVMSDDKREDGIERLSNPTVAYNEPASQSGWAALYQHLGDHQVTIGSALETGSHQASAQAVADGRADIAAIDALTWAMIARWDDLGRKLRVVGQTTPTPTLPYICAKSVDPKPVRAALEQAIVALKQTDRTLLGIKGIETVPKHQYLAVRTPPSPKNT